MQNKAKGLISLTKINLAAKLYLQPSATSILVGADGKLSSSILTCKAVSEQDGVISELSLSDYKIKYTHTYGGVESRQVEMQGDEEINVDKLYQAYTFYLYGSSQNPIDICTVPIHPNGVVDTHFQIWTGDDVPTLQNYPYTTWDDAEKHVGDYYICKYSTYYQFKKSKSGSYYWQEVTDKYLKDILSRTEDLSSMYIVYESKNTPSQYFQDIDYKVTDLMMYITGNRDLEIDNGLIPVPRLTPSQNDPLNRPDVDVYEPISIKTGSTIYMAVNNKNGQFDWDDWKPADSFSERTKDSGFEIKDNHISITADKLHFKNNAGEEVAMFSSADKDLMYIASKLINIDGDVNINGAVIANSIVSQSNIEALNLNINGSGTFEGDLFANSLTLGSGSFSYNKEYITLPELKEGVHREYFILIGDTVPTGATSYNNCRWMVNGVYTEGDIQNFVWKQNTLYWLISDGSNSNVWNIVEISLANVIKVETGMPNLALDNSVFKNYYPWTEESIEKSKESYDNDTEHKIKSYLSLLNGNISVEVTNNFDSPIMVFGTVDGNKTGSGDDTFDIEATVFPKSVKSIIFKPLGDYKYISVGGDSIEYAYKL